MVSVTLLSISARRQDGQPIMSVLPTRLSQIRPKIERVYIGDIQHRTGSAAMEHPHIDFHAQLQELLGDEQLKRRRSWHAPQGKTQADAAQRRALGRPYAVGAELGAERPEPARRSPRARAPGIPSARRDGRSRGRPRRDAPLR